MGTMTKDPPGAPQFVRYFGPVLQALEQLGGSGRPDEVRSIIAQRLQAVRIRTIGAASTKSVADSSSISLMRIR